MASIEESLRTLRDVDGVYGSFVISGAGALVSRDLPAVFDDAVLADVGPRITRIYETFASGGDELESVLLRYFEHKLYVRRLAWGMLGILCSAAVNLPALRMVGNLVTRRIDPEVGTGVARAIPRPRTPAPPAVAPRPLPPTPAPAPVAPSRTNPPPPIAETTPVVTEAPPPTNGPVRMYRGRRIE